MEITHANITKVGRVYLTSDRLKAKATQQL